MSQSANLLWAQTIQKVRREGKNEQQRNPPPTKFFMPYAFFVRNWAASAMVSAALRTSRLQADHIQLPKHLAPLVSRQHWFSLSILCGPLLGLAAFTCVASWVAEEWRLVVGGKSGLSENTRFLPCATRLPILIPACISVSSVGNRQVEGSHFFNTFYPVVSWSLEN